VPAATIAAFLPPPPLGPEPERQASLNQRG